MHTKYVDGNFEYDVAAHEIYARCDYTTRVKHCGTSIDECDLVQRPS